MLLSSRFSFNLTLPQNNYVLNIDIKYLFMLEVNVSRLHLLCYFAMMCAGCVDTVANQITPSGQ